MNGAVYFLETFSLVHTKLKSCHPSSNFPGVMNVLVIQVVICLLNRHSLVEYSIQTTIQSSVTKWSQMLLLYQARTTPSPSCFCQSELDNTRSQCVKGYSSQSKIFSLLPTHGDRIEVVTNILELSHLPHLNNVPNSRISQKASTGSNLGAILNKW